MALPRPDWLALHQEEVLDPGLPIVDPHHHLWALPGSTYLRVELLDDLRTGHDIRATVFVDCHSHYRSDGPEALRPVGETAFVLAQATAHGDDPTGLQPCAAIVGWADLMLGDQVQPVLDAHAEAGQGRFRGIRARPTWHGDPSVHPAGQGREGVLREAPVLRGVRRLGRMGYLLDVWVYHTQLADVEQLAARCPDTLIVLDHCGGPLGIGPFAGRRNEVFADWRKRIQALAKFQNIRLKLGGLAMPRIGFGFEQAERPTDSATLARAWAPWFDTCIEAFGVQRCMFESNFPVDKVGCSYAVVWNSFKRVAQGCSAGEREALFSRTAAITYGIGHTLAQR